jgi:hypothetical protein
MSKECLKQLEEAGEYVFHGSPDGSIEELEPRQSTYVLDLNKRDEVADDGLPSVSATPYPEFAVFRAMINSKNVPNDHTSEFGLVIDKEHGEFLSEFRISSQDVLDKVKDKKGFVYVLPKSNFKPYRRGIECDDVSSMEHRSHVSVKPVEVVEVSHADLPEGIKIG